MKVFPDIVSPLPVFKVPVPKSTFCALDSNPIFQESSVKVTSYFSTSSDVPISRSTRVIKRPAYLQDYHCQLASSNSIVGFISTIHSLSDVLGYSKLSPYFKASIFSVSTSVEPQSY